MPSEQRIDLDIANVGATCVAADNDGTCSFVKKALQANHGRFVQLQMYRVVAGNGDVHDILTFVVMQIMDDTTSAL